MVAIIEDGWFADVPYAIIEGSTIEVDNKGDGNYELAFNLNLSDGSTFKAYYNGPLEVTNVVLMSNLEEDYAIPSLTKGKFTVRPWSNGTNLYSGVLYSDGLNPDAGTGTGDELTLRIHTEPHNDYYTITSGNYTIAGNYDAGTVRAGYTVYGIPTDSWYRGIVNGQIKQFAPLVSGQVNIQYNSGTYTIAIDAYDDFGNNITGNFQGPITITDYVGAPTAPDEAQMSYIYTAPEYNSAAQTRTNNSRRLRNMR